MKILIGTHNIANNAIILAKGFKELGFDPTIAIAFPNPYYLNKSDSIDIQNLYKIAMVSENEEQARSILKEKEWSFLLDYDLYIFISSHSLLPGNADLKLLKQMNKLIISWNCGSELRYSLSAHSFYKRYHIDFPLNSVQINNTRSFWDLAKQSPFTDSYSKKLYNTRMMELYATMIVASTSISVFSIRPFISSILMLDTEIGKYNPQINEREYPVLIHAPTNPLYKQSNYIINTIFELWNLGYKFEFRMIRNMPNHKLLENLSDADILVDQVMCSVPGLLAHEGMSSGCVVLSCNTPNAAPIPHDIPVINVNNKNLKEKLIQVISDSTYRNQIAHASVEYAQRKTHSPKEIALYLLRSLEKSLEGKFDCYPTIVYEHTQIPQHEYVNPELQDLTNQVITQYGVPSKKHLTCLVKLGMTSLSSAQEWNLNSDYQEHEWGYESPYAKLT